jgi:hypothetical protein
MGARPDREPPGVPRAELARGNPRLRRRITLACATRMRRCSRTVKQSGQTMPTILPSSTIGSHASDAEAAVVFA